MTITGAIVLYAVIWFMTLLTIFPIGYVSQEEAGEVAPGRPLGALSGRRFKRMRLHATVISTLLWAVVCGIIMYSGLTMESIDWTRRWRE